MIYVQILDDPKMSNFTQNCYFEISQEFLLLLLMITKRGPDDLTLPCCLKTKLQMVLP